MNGRVGCSDSCADRTKKPLSAECKKETTCGAMDCLCKEGFARDANNVCVSIVDGCTYTPQNAVDPKSDQQLLTSINFQVQIEIAEKMNITVHVKVRASEIRAIERTSCCAMRTVRVLAMAKDAFVSRASLAIRSQKNVSQKILVCSL